MLDPTAKSPLKSVGALGGAGALAVSTLNAFGIQIVPNSKADVCITIVFAGLALYGRLFATQRLTSAALATPPDPG